MKKAIRVSKRILAFSLAVFVGVAILGTSMSADAKKKSTGTYAEGDDIAFGTLDGNIINWTILSYDDTTKIAFLVSRKTLNSNSVIAYRDAVNKMYRDAGTTAGYVQWIDNYWRGWLNQVFYETAFTDTEKEMIQETTLEASANQLSLMNFYHDTTLDANYVASQVKNSLNMNIYNNQTTTTDYVFFLSTDEYTEYQDNMKFETYATWPLRTNAYDDPAQGLFVNDSTKLIERKYYYLGNGIRPAMYVQLGTPTTEDTDDSDDSSTDTSSTEETEDTTTETATTTATATTVSTKSYANNGTNIGNLTLPDDSSYTMRNGGTAQVAINMDYLNSTDKEYTITYKTSDSSVFTVDSNGLITSTGTGTATLTVRMKKSNGKTYSMTCRIDVT